MGDLENTLAHELLAEVNDLFAAAEADAWAGDLCQALRKWLFRVCTETDESIEGAPVPHPQTAGSY